MKTHFLPIWITLMIFALPARSQAVSPALTFEQKVNLSDAILEVTVLEAAPPKTNDINEPAVCKAS